MKPRHALAFTIAILSLVSLAAFAQTSTRSQPSAQPTVATFESTIAAWPEVPQKAAREMYDTYGPPDGVTPTHVIWLNKAPWKEIIVTKEEVPHSFPKQHTDVLEQVINYKVPTDKLKDLAEYDGSVIVERTKGTLSARCDKEPMNFLALNLAHDIITGKRTVQDARALYAKTAMAFMKGEKDPYTQKLQFAVSQKDTADPDKPAEK